MSGADEERFTPIQDEVGGALGGDGGHVSPISNRWSGASSRRSSMSNGIRENFRTGRLTPYQLFQLNMKKLEMQEKAREKRQQREFKLKKLEMEAEAWREAKEEKRRESVPGQAVV